MLCGKSIRQLRRRWVVGGRIYLLTMEATPDLTSRREAMAAARSALAGVESVLWQATGSELGPLLREIDDLGRLVEAARVAVVGRRCRAGRCGPTS
jgi:hypothetical protein